MANNIVRYNRPTGMLTLSNAMDQLFRDAFMWPRVGAAPGAGFGLNSNLYETEDSYIMQVVLPGADAAEVQITAHQNVLTLQGKTGVPAPEGARGIWVGLGAGDFSEQVTLPGEVDADKAAASYQDGILTLTLPKAAHARPRTIKVGAGHGQGQQQAIEGETK